MSFQAMTWALRQSVGNPSGKIILLVLANYADENGSCFPSQKKLSQECECSVATVARWLKKLAETGYISRQKRYGEGGYRRSDRLVLNLHVTELPSTELHNSESILTRHSDGAEPIREPIKKNIINNIPKKPDFEAEFSETFWPQYPLKKSKGGSLKAFKAARKKSDLATIMAGVHRYAAERDGQDHQFTKHASTWLNQHCWLDEVPDPPPRPSNALSNRPNTTFMTEAAQEAYQRYRAIEDAAEQPNHSNAGTGSENRFTIEGCAG